MRAVPFNPSSSSPPASSSSLHSHVATVRHCCHHVCHAEGRYVCASVSKHIFSTSKSWTVCELWFCCSVVYMWHLSQREPLHLWLLTRLLPPPVLWPSNQRWMFALLHINLVKSSRLPYTFCPPCLVWLLFEAYSVNCQSILCNTFSLTSVQPITTNSSLHFGIWNIIFTPIDE